MFRTKVFALLANILETDPTEINKLSGDSALQSIGLSSLHLIQWIISIEEEFNIEIHDSDLDLDKFSTPDNTIKTLNKYFEKEAPIKKVLVCDCDNVLWQGISGEETIIETECSVGFCKLLRHLYECGVLLCICSKNEPKNIVEAFATHDFKIKEDCFIARRINLLDKATNIKSIAKELNLSTDSFVFVDDSDYEIGLVNTLLPEIITVKADYPDTSFFDTITSLFDDSNESDSNRTLLYLQQKNREKEKHHYATLDEYNLSIETVYKCHHACKDDAGRIAELSQRTNQFNLSGSRYTAEQISTLLSDKEHLIFIITAGDKYGDMGIIGAAVVYKKDSNQSVIESFFLSCRAFGRGFENILLNEIKKSQTGKIHGIYKPTDKNFRYKDFYSKNGVAVNE